MKWFLLAVSTAISLAGCADLSAVADFAKMAPDVAKLDTLTDVYVAAPAIQSEWAAIWTKPDPALADQFKKRQDQKVAIDALHALIVNYMKALGGLAGPGATDISAQAKLVGTNLAALQKADPSLLPTAQVAPISDLVSVIPQGILDLYRQSEVSSIIVKNQVSFHRMIDAETEIVQGSFERDISQACKAILAATHQTLGEFNSSCGPDGTIAIVVISGSPTKRATTFGFGRSANADIAKLNAAARGAQQYVTALQKLREAYDVLVQDAGHIDATTVTRIIPLLTDVEKAYSDIGSL